MMAGEEVVLMARDTFEAETQNLLALAILLGLVLVPNLSAAPVILFWRTR